MKPLIAPLICALMLCVLWSSAIAQEEPETRQQAISLAAEEHSYQLSHEDSAFFGPGWDHLLEEGRKVRFFSIGEEHGIAENAELAAALFSELARHGYSKFVIEVSPYMAERMDDSLSSGGIEGLKNLFREPGGEPAFFGMKEEAQMLASVRQSVRFGNAVFWGVDYEVLGDRQMISELEGIKKPESASNAVKALREASDTAWERYAESGNLGEIFSFSGDPAHVREVIAQWPDLAAYPSRLLNTLEQTLEINRLFITGENWASNRMRAELIRSNFLKHWNGYLDLSPPERPRVMLKLGASHLARGRNSNGVFDLGTLLPELADIEGERYFSMLVLPGRGASTAVFDTASVSYRPAPPKDRYDDGLDLLFDVASGDEFTLIDLRPLRQYLGGRPEPSLVKLADVAHGFDMILIMNGSTASEDLMEGSRHW